LNFAPFLKHNEISIYCFTLTSTNSTSKI